MSELTGELWNNGKMRFGCLFLSLRWPLLLVLILFVGFGGLWGCGLYSDKATRGYDHDKAPRIFRMNLGTEPPELDPIKMVDLTSFTVVQNLMRGLTEIGQGQQVNPSVAKRWTLSEDGLTYTFYLREDAYWSDGKPITAKDFIYGWQRALDPKNGADYAFFLFEIKNGKAFYEGKITDFSHVGAQALNDRTLQVVLERPLAFFTGLMAAPVALPMRQDIIEKYGNTFTEAGHFVTNGPYVLDRWRHEEKIVLKPDPLFFGSHSGQKPKVDAVEMVMVTDPNTSVVMYENDELDFIETTTSIPSFDVRRLRDSPECQTSPLHRINYFGFNTKKPPFDNPKVRQAFALALDRSYYPKLMQSGQEPIASWISPGLAGYNPKRGLNYEPVRARQLLAEAGYPNGKGFPAITAGYRTMYDTQKEMEIAQFLWKQTLNVDVKLENMEWKVFLSRLKNDAPHIYRLGWFVDYPDADSFMAMMTGDSGNNFTGWQDDTYDELVKQAATTLDTQQRQNLYNQAQRILLEEAAAIVPIYLAEKTYLLKPRVKHFKINEINLINLDSLTIEN